MGGLSFLPSREAFSRASTAAMKALEIDESLPEAQSAALGLVRALFDWDWAGADRAFRRAVELNPESPDAHTGYLIYLIPMGRFQEGMAHAKRGRTRARPRRLRGASASARCTSFPASNGRGARRFSGRHWSSTPDLGVRSAGGSGWIYRVERNVRGGHCRVPEKNSATDLGICP